MALAETSPIQRRLTDLTLEFLAALELERGLSRNTLEAYRSDLQQYGVFLTARGRDPLEVEPADLAAFVSELAGGAAGRRPLAFRARTVSAASRRSRSISGAKPVRGSTSRAS